MILLVIKILHAIYISFTKYLRIKIIIVSKLYILHFILNNYSKPINVTYQKNIPPVQDMDKKKDTVRDSERERERERDM